MVLSLVEENGERGAKGERSVENVRSDAQKHHCATPRHNKKGKVLRPDNLSTGHMELQTKIICNSTVVWHDQLSASNLSFME